MACLQIPRCGMKTKDFLFYVLSLSIFFLSLYLTRLQACLHVKWAIEENKSCPFFNTVPFVHCKIAQKEKFEFV